MRTPLAMYRSIMRGRRLTKAERQLREDLPRGFLQDEPPAPRNRAERRAAGMRRSAGGRYFVPGVRLAPEVAAAVLSCRPRHYAGVFPPVVEVRDRDLTPERGFVLSGRKAVER